MGEIFYTVIYRAQSCKWLLYSVIILILRGKKPETYKKHFLTLKSKIYLKRILHFNPQKITFEFEKEIDKAELEVAGVL